MRVRVWILLAGMSLAVPSAGAQSPTTNLEEALLRLGDRSAKVRAQAALVLGMQEASDEIRAALRDRLSDSSPLVRAAAAKALGRRPTPDLLEPMAALARDPDPMVAKWASWALRRTVASAARLRITDTTFRISGTREPRSVGRTFESELLRGLLASDGPFELDSRDTTLDFSAGSADEPAPAASTVDANRLLREGRFDMAMMAAPEDGKDSLAAGPCALELSGTVEMREGAGEVQVRASVRLVLPGGVPVLEAAAEVRAAPPSGDSRERDEYTLEVTPAQLRLQAAGEAGRRVAEDLHQQLHQVLQDARRGEGGS